MGSKKIVVIVLIELMLCAGLLGIGYRLIDLNNDLHALTDQTDRKLRQSADRIATIESYIQSLPLAHQIKSIDGFLPSIEQRLDLVERQINSLRVRKEKKSVERPINKVKHAESGKEIDSTQQKVVLGQSVQMLYDGEGGRSDWGESLAAEIIEAFPNTPFFSNYGGNLAIDCKQTTCKLEWSMPHLNSLSPQDRDEMLAMTEYELLALAARDSAQVGRFNIRWKMENGRPRVAVFFARKGQAR